MVYHTAAERAFIAGGVILGVLLSQDTLRLDGFLDFVIAPLRALICSSVRMRVIMEFFWRKFSTLTEHLRLLV